MARLGGSGGSGGAAPAAAPASSPAQQVTAQQDDDGRALYEILAEQVGAMSTAEQLAMGAALRQNDYDAIPEDQRVLFREAAAEFLDEGGA